MKQKILHKALYTLFFLLNLFPLQGEISWTDPELLFVEDGWKKNPLLSINQAGDAFIGWVNSSDRRIEIAKYDYIENKIHSPTIAYPGSGDLILLDLILTDAQELFILWIDQEQDTLHAAIYDMKHSIWLESVTASEAHHIENPALKLDGHGNAMICWTKFTGFEYQVQSLYFSGLSKKWGVPITLSPMGFNCHLQKFAFDSQGNAVAVWKSTLLLGQIKLGNNYGIQAVRFSFSDQNWSPPFFFEALSNYVMTEPDILFDASDNLIILWKRVHIASENEILQYITYNFSNSHWGNKSDILTEGKLSKPKLVLIQSQIFALWQSHLGTEDRLQTIRLVYPSSALPEVTTIATLHDQIADYKIKTDGRGKMKVIFADASQVGVSERAEIWQKSALFTNQSQPQALQIQGDALGNTVIMWKTGNNVLFSHGDYLFSPTRLSGRVIQKRFAAKSVKFIQLSWMASKSPSIKGYRIRRNNLLLNEIHCSQTQFLDRHLPRGEFIYSITSFNDENLESRPIELIIRN